MKNSLVSLSFAAVVAFLLAVPVLADVEHDASTGYFVYTAKAQRAWEQTEAKLDDAPTNMDMLSMIQDCFDEVDLYLNLAYKKAIEKLQSRAPQLVEKLRADQRAWLAFVVPLTNEIFGNFGHGGTAYYVMGASSQVRLWVQRINYLEMIVDEASSELLPG